MVSDFLNRIRLLRSVAVGAGLTPSVSLAELPSSSHFPCPCQHLRGSPPQVTVPSGVLVREHPKISAHLHPWDTTVRDAGTVTGALRRIRNWGHVGSRSYRRQFWGSLMSLGVPLAAISCPGSSELIGNPSQRHLGYVCRWSEVSVMSGQCWNGRSHRHPRAPSSPVPPDCEVAGGGTADSGIRMEGEE